MKKQSGLLLLTFLLGCYFLMGDISSVFAEGSGIEVFTLDEITVTAQKREENLQKVPIAMEVISSEDIKALAKNDLDEIISKVSSAIVQKAADGYRISIRGISDDSSSSMGQSMAAPTVAVNTDGVYSNRKDTGMGLFDIERVEVLYGPQSTMYSSNSPGGIVNVVTAAPKTDKLEVSASIEAGSYGLLHTDGAVNVPVNDITALRASVSTSKRDGYLTGGGDSEDTKSGRLRALYQPNEKLSFTVTGELTKDTGSGFGGGVVLFADQDDTDDPWTAASNESLNENDQTTKKIFLNMKLDTGLGELTFVPSYSTRNGTNEMNMNNEIWCGDQSAREKSVELRMTSSDDFFIKWILGASYYDSKDEQNMISLAYLTTGLGEYSYRSNTQETKAAFLNITYPIIDKMRLTGGIRASWDEMVTDNYENKIEGGQYDLKDQEPAQNVNDGRPDYKLGFEYDLGTNSMLYGSYSTSYRVQSMLQGKTLTSEDPQELKAFSVGAKNRFFGNKLQLNVATYYYKYSNYNVSYKKSIWYRDYDGDGEEDGGGRGNDVPEVEQEEMGVVSDGTMYGGDLSMSAIITPQDMLDISAAYIHSEWDDLYFDWEHTDQTVLVNGVPTVVELKDSDFSGKPISNTPPWTITLAYSHNFNLWNGGSIKATVNSKYQTGYHLSWNNEEEYPENYQEAHHMESANATYNHSNGNWSLAAYVDNIFNYAEKRTFMGAGGMSMLDIGDPRTYGIILSVKF